MAGIPPEIRGWQPQTSEEHAIAAVMTLTHRLIAEIRRQLPHIPEVAISKGLINSGIQTGCDHHDPYEIAEYLRGAATYIAPPH